MFAPTTILSSTQASSYPLPVTVNDNHSSDNLQIKPDEVILELENKVQKLQGKVNFYHFFSKLFFGSDAKQQWQQIFTHTSTLSQYISNAKIVSEQIKNAKGDTDGLSQTQDLDNLIQKKPHSLCVGDSPSFADSALGYMVMAGGALFLLHALPSIIALIPAVMSLAFIKTCLELAGGLFLIGYACGYSVNVAGYSAEYQLTQVRNEFSNVLVHMKKVQVVTQSLTQLKAMDTENEQALTPPEKEQIVIQLLTVFKALGIEKKQAITQLLTLSEAIDTEKRQILTQLLISSKPIEINIPQPMREEYEYSPNQFLEMVIEERKIAYSLLKKENAKIETTSASVIKNTSRPC